MLGDCGIFVTFEVEFPDEFELFVVFIFVSFDGIEELPVVLL